jgi:mono/diheme cytochrome c family protein
MMSSRVVFIVWTAGICVGLIALQALLRPDTEVRHFEIFTEMAYSHASEPFTPNPYFADGKTQQPLVAGVVPRGLKPFPYGIGPEEAKRAGEELFNPINPADTAAPTVGAELYRVYCLMCHDARGNGEGPVVYRGMLPPPSLHADRAKQMADGEMFHILTRGQGNMASYAAQLSRAERWKVIQHVRRLQEEGP